MTGIRLIKKSVSLIAIGFRAQQMEEENGGLVNPYSPEVQP